MSEKKHFIFTVTRNKIEDTMLYKNMVKYHLLHTLTGAYNFNYKENNTDGLSKCYNEALENYADEYDYIHFIHDDVEILDNWERLKDDIESRPDWMVTGVAGPAKVEIKYPSLWNTMGDPKSFKGSLHHLTEDDKHYFSTPCGLRPARTAMLDGVYLCVNTELFRKGFKFDEQFMFHHYDLDFTLRVVQAGYKIGVGNFNIVHKSHGLSNLNDQSWQESNKLFLAKHQKQS